MRQEQSNERKLNKLGRLSSGQPSCLVGHGLMHARWQVADLLSRPAPLENGAGPVAELAPVLYVSGEESVEQVCSMRFCPYR